MPVLPHRKPFLWATLCATLLVVIKYKANSFKKVNLFRRCHPKIHHPLFRHLHFRR
jgi:hypothetical protein